MLAHRKGGPSRLRPLVALLTLGAVALVLSGCTAAAPTGPAQAATSGLDVSPSALALQQQFVQVVKQVGPAVVLIRTSEGLGSGIVFDAKGDVVTNNHVVDNADGFQVTLANGRQYRARLVGSFPADDLAVLHVGASGLHPAAFADSSRLQVGDVAQVIGIPTLAATDPELGGTAPGLGFAIPSNIVRDIAAQLIDQGKVINSHRAYLGVVLGTTTSGGVLVVQVQPGGPAAKAGIAAGELLAAVDGTATPDQATLADVLAGLQPGQTVSVAVIRPDGTRHAVRVTLGQYPG